MRRVLEYSTLVDAPVITHAEDRTLVAGGVVNEGAGLDAARPARQSRRSPRRCTIARDLVLARVTGAHLHVAHVSTRGGDRADPARARARHPRDRRGRAAPPDAHRRGGARLRHQREDGAAAALARTIATRAAPALADGTIDAIATDHAPHALHEKELDFREAPPGMIGFETALAVVLDLVRARRAHAARAGAPAVDEPGAHPARGGRDARARARSPTS